MDLLIALCLTERFTCSNQATLVGQAEETLRGRLADDSLAGILPDGETCRPTAEKASSTMAVLRAAVIRREPG